MNVFSWRALVLRLVFGTCLFSDKLINYPLFVKFILTHFNILTTNSSFETTVSLPAFYGTVLTASSALQGCIASDIFIMTYIYLGVPVRDVKIEVGHPSWNRNSRKRFLSVAVSRLVACTCNNDRNASVSIFLHCIYLIAFCNSMLCHQLHFRQREPSQITVVLVHSYWNFLQI
jgi:hypothetical protein